MALLLILLSGYGVSYDGYEDQKHYLQINTPSVDYGIIVSEDGIECDMIFYKK